MFLHSIYSVPLLSDETQTDLHKRFESADRSQLVKDLADKHKSISGEMSTDSAIVSASSN